MGGSSAKQIPVLWDDPLQLRLSPKQRRFVLEVIACGNGAEAARRAGYSEKTARVIAKENLTKPNILAAIKKERERLDKESRMTVERLEERLARIVYADPRGLYDENGQRVPVHKINDDLAAAVESIEDVQGLRGRKQRVKLRDAIQAALALARLRGWIIERKELSGPGGKPLQVENLSEEDLDARIAGVEEEIRGMRSDGKRSGESV